MVQIGAIKNSFFLIGFLIFIGCVNNSHSTHHNSSDLFTKINVPKFNSDSAYYFIKKQVDFGPRVPNTVAHEKCAEYLINQFQSFGAAVKIQEDLVSRFDGVNMFMKNIIASYNLDANKRILLCAHWDSRFMADYDSIDIQKPISGANDGGSGVGVLLEIARQFYNYPVDVGIDIILFDVEDQGQPNGALNPVPHSWCLGSQYWSKNPHVSNYFADYGILLDMVGGEGAKFTKEGVSLHFASTILDKVWDFANRNGFNDFFLDQETPSIIDDHLYINNIIHIPTINIVEYDVNSHNRFNKHHHKHSDNMQIIDKKTLNAVGQTVLDVIYHEKL